MLTDFGLCKEFHPNETVSSSTTDHTNNRCLHNIIVSKGESQSVCLVTKLEIWLTVFATIARESKHKATSAVACYSRLHDTKDVVIHTSDSLGCSSNHKPAVGRSFVRAHDRDRLLV